MNSKGLFTTSVAMQSELFRLWNEQSRERKMVFVVFGRNVARECRQTICRLMIEFYLIH